MKIPVLITGGAGFIGSHIADYCIDKLHFKTVILDNLSGGSINNVHPQAEIIKGSINDVLLINSLFKKYKFKYVYHLAAYAAENLSHFIKRFNYENNLIGSINLINASINNNIKCFIFTSSIAVYGKNQLPMSEDMIPIPEDSYGIAKLAVERELEISKKIFGLNYIIFRPHNVYGEKQNIADKYRNVIGIFMNRILQHKKLEIFGDGRQKRAFTYIGDIAPHIAKSVKEKNLYNQKFNLGSDSNYSVNNLAKMVMETMGKDTKITHLRSRNEVKFAYADHKKYKKFAGISTSETKLAAGLAKMAKWAQKMGAQQSRKFRNIEIKKNLPDTWE